MEALITQAPLQSEQLGGWHVESVPLNFNHPLARAELQEKQEIQQHARESLQA